MTPRLPGSVSEGAGPLSLSNHLSDWGYAAGWRLVRAAPEFVARNTFDAGALWASRGGGPEQLRKNLARITGTTPERVPGALMRASLSSYARYWREAFRLPSMDHTELGERLWVDDIEMVWAALQNGHGAVLALPHSGNWDMAGVWLVQHHGPFATVAERLKPESLYKRFLAYRESLGFEVVPSSGGERPAYDVIRDYVADNGIVCLMADRDLSRRGVQVDFFGEPTRLPAGPAKLSLDTGAPLFPVHCWFDGDGWGMKVYPAIDTSSGDITVVTQLLADRFAANIAAHPQDWHMMQPQWLADLSDERRAHLDGGPRRGDSANA